MQETTLFSLSAYDDVSRQLSSGIVLAMRKGSMLQWQNIVSEINCLWNVKALFLVISHKYTLMCIIEHINLNDELMVFKLLSNDPYLQVL